MRASHSKKSYTEFSPNRKKLLSIDKILVKSIRDFSKEKEKKEYEEIKMRESRRLHQKSMENLNAIIRDQNKRKFAKDKPDLRNRLPWGMN